MDYAVTSSVLIACVVLKLVLVGIITRRRLSSGVALGDGGDRQLNVAIRAHANLLENAPFAILLFLLAEIQGANQWLLAGLGLVFVLSRLVHPWGLIRSNGGSHPGRFYGTLFSWLILAALCSIVLWSVVI